MQVDCVDSGRHGWVLLCGCVWVVYREASCSLENVSVFVQGQNLLLVAQALVAGKFRVLWIYRWSLSTGVVERCSKAERLSTTTNLFVNKGTCMVFGTVGLVVLLRIMQILKMSLYITVESRRTCEFLLCIACAALQLLVFLSWG